MAISQPAGNALMGITPAAAERSAQNRPPSSVSSVCWGLSQRCFCPGSSLPLQPLPRAHGSPLGMSEMYLTLVFSDSSWKTTDPHLSFPRERCKPAAGESLPQEPSTTPVHVYCFYFSHSFSSRQLQGITSETCRKFRSVRLPAFQTPKVIRLP